MNKVKLSDVEEYLNKYGKDIGILNSIYASEYKDVIEKFVNVIKKYEKAKNNFSVNTDNIYTAMYIAQYIINYCIKNHIPIDNLTLQKLLYYVQAKFLVEKDKPCFEDKIIKWKHGPVVKEVYNQYKKYLSYPIKDIQTGYTGLTFEAGILKVEDVQFDEDYISKEDKKLINDIIEKYKKFTNWEMVYKICIGDPCRYTEEGEEIKLNLIREYYMKNKQDI